MKTPSLAILSLGLSIYAASTLIPGCSQPAQRTLTIGQYQSTPTMDGPFEIDTRGLPHDAVESRTESSETGSPNTTIHLNMHYEFEIVVRLKNSAAVASHPNKH